MKLVLSVNSWDGWDGFIKSLDEKGYELTTGPSYEILKIDSEDNNKIQLALRHVLAQDKRLVIKKAMED